jgi:hypothetical protein
LICDSDPIEVLGLIQDPREGVGPSSTLDEVCGPWIPESTRTSGGSRKPEREGRVQFLKQVNCRHKLTWVPVCIQL